MSDRPSLEKEVSDTKKSIAQLDKDIKQLREWISANERGLNGMPESLRRITEDGITRARGELAQRENSAQTLRGTLAANEQLLRILADIERKEQDISTLEREQEKLIVLLERHRAELSQLRMTYDDITRPVVRRPCEVVLPNNQRVPLDQGQGEYVIGWQDAPGQPNPDIDVGVFGGSSMGVSRRHAVLRFRDGEWQIEDLGSTNGTFVDETPVSPRAPALVRDKTTIRVGNVKMFFRYVTQTTRL